MDVAKEMLPEKYSHFVSLKLQWHVLETWKLARKRRLKNFENLNSVLINELELN